MLSHLLQQGPVIGSLLTSARESLFAKSGAIELSKALGRVVETTVPARPRSLVDAYIRHTGGDPASYRNVLPAHMFLQWAMPAAAATLRGANLPLMRVINAGCKLEMRAPLPSNQPLLIRAKLDRADNDGRRILLEQEIITGTRESPDAVVARLFAYVPLAASAGTKSKGRERPLVSETAREIARYRLAAGAGLQFAALTGDINPIHWASPYARAMGFSRPVLHGFSAMARAIEGIQRNAFSGDASQIREFSARLVRPLPLPANVGLFLEGSRVWIGEANGAAAYLTGEFRRGGGTAPMSDQKELS